MKQRAGDGESDKDAKDGLAKVRERVQAIGGKTFVLKNDGRWVDTAWDGKKETRKVEAYSEAWTALLAKSDDVARMLALGDRLVVVLEGEVLEVEPATVR